MGDSEDEGNGSETYYDSSDYDYDEPPNFFKQKPKGSMLVLDKTFTVSSAVAAAAGSGQGTASTSHTNGPSLVPRPPRNGGQFPDNGDHGRLPPPARPKEKLSQPPKLNANGQVKRPKLERIAKKHGVKKTAQ